MLTADEGKMIRDIKERVLAKKFVSDTEKQLVLDLLKREQLSVRASVIQRAANSGFDVSGIKTTRR